MRECVKVERENGVRWRIDSKHRVGGEVETRDKEACDDAGCNMQEQGSVATHRQHVKKLISEWRLCYQPTVDGIPPRANWALIQPSNQLGPAVAMRQRVDE